MANSTLMFKAGDRVFVSGAAGWPEDATGTVSSPPPEVVSLSGSWIEGVARREEWATVGQVTVYWVIFDQPQMDASGDGPYRGGSVEGEALAHLA